MFATISNRAAGTNARRRPRCRPRLFAGRAKNTSTPMRGSPESNFSRKHSMFNWFIFNWFDIALAIVILASAAAGLRTGFARVVVGFAATIAGFLAGFWCYRLVAAKLTWISSTAMANVVGFLIIFIGISIL